MFSPHTATGIKTLITYTYLSLGEMVVGQTSSESTLIVAPWLRHHTESASVSGTTLFSICKPNVLAVQGP